MCGATVTSATGVLPSMGENPTPIITTPDTCSRITKGSVTGDLGEAAVMVVSVSQGEEVFNGSNIPLKPLRFPRETLISWELGPQTSQS